MRLRLLSIAAGVLLFASAGCKKQEPAPEFKASATVREIMASMVAPNADFVFYAVSSSVTPKGTEEKSPKTEEEWAEVRHRTITIMEATDLLLIPGRHIAAPGQTAINAKVQLSPEEIETLIAQNRAAWTTMAHDLHDSLLPTLKAIDSKDATALSDSTIAIDMACEKCHLKFWYPDKR